LNARIYETIWEIDVYRKGGNPSGNSLTMRFEFWKAGWNIFKNHLITGIGTGDVKNAFATQYKLDHSKLDERWRLRGHNQYLTIAIALGLPGLILFIFSLIYPLFHNHMYQNYFYAVFWLIAVLSFITEDTLETQAGATFFALFNSVFLFSQPKSMQASLLPESLP
jgi:O-antigen ligase